MSPVSSLLNIRLEHHNHIAYDLDGTLFGIYSKILETYIKNNPNKIHSVVTSRPSTLSQQSTNRLIAMFGDTLPFEHIIHSPSPNLEGHRVDPNFKGSACSRIGATVLIDDWVIHRPGCIVNSINFVHIHQPM